MHYLYRKGIIYMKASAITEDFKALQKIDLTDVRRTEILKNFKEAKVGTLKSSSSIAELKKMLK
jgi:hypothetical protein